MTRRLATAAAALTISLLVQRPGAGQEFVVSASNLLDEYDRGHRDAVVATLAGLPDAAFGQLKSDFSRVAVGWTNAVTAEPAHRRLVAATLALEIARAGLYHEWRVVYPLVRMGSELVRKNAAGPLERLWHLAAVALAEGARDSTLLLSLGLIEQAKSQFPDEPRFRLAEAIVREFPYASEGRRDDTWRSDAELESMGRTGAFELQRRDELRGAAKEFTPLLNIPAIRGEACLHIGRIFFLLHRSAEAISLLGEASKQVDDPVVVYLSLFFTGRALEMGARPADAERAYRQALVALPNVQSGAEALAARLFLDGRPDEAYAIVQAAFEARPRPLDVWRLYAFGDFRRWPDLIRRLRTEIR